MTIILILLLLSTLFLGIKYINAVSVKNSKRMDLRKRMGQVVQCNGRGIVKEDTYILTLNRTKQMIRDDRESLMNIVNKVVVNYVEKMKQLSHKIQVKFNLNSKARSQARLAQTEMMILNITREITENERRKIYASIKM